MSWVVSRVIDFTKDSEYIRMYGKKKEKMFNYKGVKMLDKIKQGADGAIDVGIKLISLSIVLQIIFGSKVAFLTGNVIGSILDIVWTLGNAGLAGIIAAGIIWKLLDKDITKELSE